MDDDGQECLVRFYPDSLDSPPWPGANLDGSAEAAHQRTNLRRFQKMGHTRFNPVTYRSAAVAPARDVLTMRPFIDGHELMPPEWAEWAELDLDEDEDHPLSELFDEDDDFQAELDYPRNIRDAFPCPPVDVPVMLGYPIISEEAMEFWMDSVHYPETPVGLREPEGQPPPAADRAARTARLVDRLLRHRGDPEESRVDANPSPHLPRKL